MADDYIKRSDALRLGNPTHLMNYSPIAGFRRMEKTTADETR